jgi:2-polyprenyl-3-methyl-5-hydroxy-6-metoxy-1,4-benzoquinol methylase
MKNILHDTPTSPLNPRLTESIRFVEDSNVQGCRVLDIGCGYGWFENNVLQRGVIRVDGIEISELDLQTAKDNISDERVVFTIAGALELPFADNTFDTVVSWEVIEHIPKHTEPQMFKEVARVLKPGGHFYLSTPYDSFSSKASDPAWWLIGHRHYSSALLTEYGTASGLSVVQINRKGKFWSLAYSMNMYVSKWLLRRKPLFANYFLKEEFKEYMQPDGTATIFVRYEKAKVG